MKKIGVKKLAAIAAGAALLGTAMAPFAIAAASDLSRTDIYDASSGSPIVNIVVGSTAKASDIIWAGNIAAKIAEKATTEKTITKTVSTGTADTSAAEIKVTVGGTKTVTGAQTLQDSMNSVSGATESQFKDQNVTSGTVPSLKYYADKSYVYVNTTYTTTMQEKLNFTADAYYDSLTAKGLVASISAGNMKYVVDLGSGIPIYESTGSSTAFSDGANDNIRVPFLGDEYLVKSISVSSGSASQVELVKSTAEKEYLEGEKITGLKGKDGEDYEILIGAGATYAGTVKINLSLFDTEGNKAATDVQVASGEDVTFYNDAGTAVLETSVTLSNLGTTTTSNTTIYKPFFLIGTDRLLLKNANGYPYDASLKATDYSYWTTLVTDSNNVKRIEIATREKLAKTSTNALKAGGKVDFMNNYATLQFVGLQLPEFADASKNERTTGITIGGGSLSFKDNTNEITQSLPFYMSQLSFTNTASASNTALSQLGTTVAGKPMYGIIRHTADVDVNLTDGLSFNGITLDVNSGVTGGLSNVCYTEPRSGTAVCDTNSDGSINIGGMEFGVVNTGVGTTGADANVGSWITVKANGGISFSYSSYATDENSSTKQIGPGILYYADKNVFSSGVLFQPAGVESTSGGFRYSPMIREVSSGTLDIWFFLTKQNITTQYSKIIALNGTDVDEDRQVDTGVPGGMIQTRSRFPYYLPHLAELPSYLGGSRTDANYTADSIYVAQFLLDDDESGVAATSDFNVAINTGTGDLIRVGTGSNLSNYSTELAYDLNQQGKVGWSLSTQSTTYASTGYSDFGTKVVLDSSKATFTVPENIAKAEIKISGTGTVETTTGGEEVTVKSGETGTTTSGTKITISEISGVTVSGESEEPETETVTVAAGLGGKGKIVQDSIDPGAAILIGGQKVNRLTRALTDIAAKLAKAGDSVVEMSGNKIVVAGYTASDTGTAAQELIAWLDTQ